MYPISNTARTLFRNEYRQVARITLGNGFIITESDIEQNGLSINRYSKSGSEISFGEMVAAELTLTLHNSTGRFNSILSNGTELFVEVGIKKWDAHAWENAQLEYIPMGYFIIDSIESTQETMNIKALDRMVSLDINVNTSQLSVPISVSNLFKTLCVTCGINLSNQVEIDALANSDYIITQFPSDNYTYREYLSLLAEIMGACGFIDYNGDLMLKWYSDTDITITPSDRYSSTKDELVTITGVRITHDSNSIIVGGTSYPIKIDSNAFIMPEDASTIASNIYEQLHLPMSVMPFSAVVTPMPEIYPLDTITFVASDNSTKVCSLVTSVTFGLNKNTEISGDSQSETQQSYATPSTLLKRERYRLDKLLANAEQEIETLASNTQVQLLTNTAIFEFLLNKAGAYITTISNITVISNEPLLADSTAIFICSSNGLQQLELTKIDDMTQIESVIVNIAGSENASDLLVSDKSVIRQNIQTAFTTISQGV